MNSKKMLLAAVAGLGSLVVQAQQLVVYGSDGTRTVFAVDQVDSICFVDNRIGGHEYVDLGLGVLWAACNVGAGRPEQGGDFFAWGETEPKTDYSEDGYRYYVNDQYVNIGTDICGTSYDAATVQWGAGWRLPSLADIDELTGQCTWTPDTVGGMKGFRVTGPNGASLFLPAAGYSAGPAPTGVGSKGFYWTGTRSSTLGSAAYNVNFTGYTGHWTASRAYGLSVRPVHDR